jgi:ribosomal protein S18 acetylase RimI-like enzyme
VFSWCYPDTARRRQIIPRFFATITESSVAHNEPYTTDNVRAGAVWIPPGVEDDVGQLTATLAQISGEYAQRLLKIFTLLDEEHPHQPYYYLFFLGTRPEWQSRGTGSALMKTVLKTCDQDKVPAYLEATSERSKRLYLRHGFQVTGEVQLPEGPSMWRMWRTSQ